MKRLTMTGLALLMVTSMMAQVDDDWSRKVRESQQNAREEYEKFRQEAQQNYSDFRKKANEDYARFMENPWTAFITQSAEEIPRLPKPPQPVLADPKPQPDVIPIPYAGQPLPPEPIVHPQPIEPLKPTIEPDVPKDIIRFYGTDVAFHFPTANNLHLNGVTEKNASKMWKQLSTPAYDNLLAECLQNRTLLNLCDWGYVMLTEQVAESVCGGHTNEAVVMHMYLLTQSGYQTRLCKADNRFYVLIGSRDKIYRHRFFTINGVKYYLFDKSYNSKSAQIFNNAFPQEKLLTLSMTQPNLSVVKTQPRTITSKKYSSVKATVVLNKNLIDFYNSCPLTDAWELYSQASLSDMAKDSLYPVLRKTIQNKSQSEAANILINFVQTGFDYATDQKQFGYERPLYPDESLYYPYNDCEDRSIFYACLVRELMGLDVVLLDYPDHLATAVHFTDDVKGDYLMLDGNKYIVCDPTYIGADIGRSMPSMKGISPNVVVF